jgi:2-dehydropantoate 2-reductase
MSSGLGQVPVRHLSPIRYGILGDGRVARHFARYLTLLNLPFRQWSRAQAGSPQAALQDCQVILVLVSDPAVESLARLFPDQPRFHFSGSLVTAEADGAHPLMTFGPELYQLAEYQKIPFVVENPESFRRAFPTLPNPCFPIRLEDKARYHALCAMAGNFTLFLWAKLFQEFPEKFGIPSEAALPYLERVSRNLAADPTHAERFFTGPIARGDTKAIERHLDSLEGDPYQSVYEAFVTATSTIGVSSL